MTRSRNIGIVLLCLVGLAIPVAYFVYLGRAPRLANEAADMRVSSGYRIQDISTLSKMRGRRVTRLLVILATDQSVPFDSRNAAVAALKSRNDPSVSNDLAMLLQPHNSEALRHAVADTLSQLPCPENCTFSVLYYLERAWRGDRNSGEAALDDPSIEELAKLNPNQVKTDMARDRQRQQQLVSELESILSKNPEQTLAVLHNVYGLGSYDPSYFAIYMVGQLRLSQACPDFERPHLDDIVGEKMATQIRAVRQQLCSNRPT